MGLNDTPPSLVRLAAVADAEAIAEIHVSAWQAAYRGIVPDPILDDLSAPQHAREWQRHLAEPEGAGARVWVIEDGELLGFALTGAPEDRDLDPTTTLELVALYVHPTRWRRGLGRRLVAACLDDARQRELGTVSLWVLDANRPARNFYRRLGFEPDGRHELRRIGGIDLPTTRYRRSVGSTR